MRTMRGMRGVIAAFWVVLRSISDCWGVPAVQNHSVTPSELRSGLGYRVDVYTSSDVTSMIVQVDLRPTSSQVFRLIPTVGDSGTWGKRWTAAGQVPPDLHPAPGAEATFRVIAMDALRSQVRVNFTRPLLGARVDCQLGSWENTGICDATTGKELWRRSVAVPAQYGGAECVGPTEEWRDSWRVATVLWDPPWTTWSGECVDGIEQGYDIKWTEYRNCAGQSDWREQVIPSERPCAVDCVMDIDWKPIGDCDAQTGQQWWELPVLVPARNGGSCVGPIQRLGFCRILCDEWGGYEPWSVPAPWEFPYAANGCVSPILLRAGKSLDQIHRTEVLQVTYAGGQLSPGCDTQYDYCLTESDDGRGNAVKLGVVETRNCVVGDWYPVGECNPETGTRIYRRDIVMDPTPEGLSCPTLEEERPCPVDCDGIYRWAGYSQDYCDRMTGTRNEYIHHRWHTYVEPKNGGRGCPPEFVVDPIGSAPCLVDCELGNDWIPIGECNPETGTQLWELPVFITAKNGGTCSGPIREVGFCTMVCDEWGGYEPWAAPSPGVIPYAANGCVSPILLRAGKSLDQIHRTEVLQVTYAGGQLSPGCDAQYDYCLTESDDGRGNAVKLGVVETRNCVVGDWYAVGECNPETGTRLYRRDIVIGHTPGGVLCPPLEEERPCAVDCDGHWESSIEWGACDSNCVRRGVKHWNWVTILEPRNGGQPCPANYDEPVQERCAGWVEAPGFFLEGWVLYSGGPKGGVWVDLDGTTYTAWNGEIHLPNMPGYRIELQFEGGNKGGHAWYTPGQGTYVPQQKNCP